MCQVCEMHGDEKHYLGMRVPWTDSVVDTIGVKNINDIEVSVIDWTKSENACTKLGKMKHCWNCGKKL